MNTTFMRITRALTGETVYVNEAHIIQIAQAKESPGSVLTLTNGRNIMAKEPVNVLLMVPDAGENDDEEEPEE